MRFTLLMLTVFLLFSCKKDESDPTPNPPAILEMEKSEYKPLEAALATVPEYLMPAEYVVKINDIEYPARGEGNDLAFIIPDLTPGSYNIVFQFSMVKIFSAQISIVALTELGDAQFINTLQNQSNQFEASLLGMVTNFPLQPIDRINLTHDINLVSDTLDNYYALYSSLSDPDKRTVRRFYAANRSELDEMALAINEFAAEVELIPRAPVDDYDRKVNEAMQKYVMANLKLFKNVFKIAAAVGTLYAFVINPWGAAVGAAIVITALKMNHFKQNIAQEKLLNAAIMPESEFLAQRNPLIQFESGVQRDLIVTMKYRSLKNSDRSNTNVTVTKIVDEMDKLYDMWYRLNSAIASLLLHVPKTIDNYTATIEVTRPIHSNYLTVSNVTNNHVTLTSNPLDGQMRLSAKNTEVNPESFDFTLSYNNPLFDEHTIQIPATVTGTLEGTWTMISFMNGTPVGQAYTYYQSNCASIPFYSEAERGTMTFTHNTFNWTWNSTVIDFMISYQTSPCAITGDGPNETQQNSDSGSGTYIFDGANFILTEGGSQTAIEILSPNTFKIGHQVYQKE